MFRVLLVQSDLVVLVGAIADFRLDYGRWVCTRCPRCWRIPSVFAPKCTKSPRLRVCIPRGLTHSHAPPPPPPPPHPLRSLPRKAKIVTINRNPVSLALNSGEPRAKHILSYRVESIVFVMITLAAPCI